MGEYSRPPFALVTLDRVFGDHTEPGVTSASDTGFFRARTTTWAGKGTIRSVRGEAWLSRQVGDLKIAGSNPVVLTGLMRWDPCWYGLAAVNRPDAGSIPAAAAFKHANGRASQWAMAAAHIDGVRGVRGRHACL